MKKIRKIKGLPYLKSKEYVTKEVLQEIIEDKLVETYYWLKRAYDVAPYEDPHIREQITEISAQLLKMRIDINEAFTKPE